MTTRLRHTKFGQEAVDPKRVFAPNIVQLRKTKKQKNRLIVYYDTHDTLQTELLRPLVLAWQRWRITTPSLSGADQGCDAAYRAGDWPPDRMQSPQLAKLTSQGRLDERREHSVSSAPRFLPAVRHTLTSDGEPVRVRSR